MLEIQNLTITLKMSGDPVVRDVSLTVNDGEALGLVGESGSGKTVTALTTAGLLPRSAMTASGQILLDGADLLKCSREELRRYQGRDIGMIFQEPMTSLNPLMKVGKQVEESLRIHTSFTNAQRRERALSAMAAAELSDPETLYDRYPHELSGGMRQRVMIAAAIITDPGLLIADEPTTALDVTIQAQIIALLKRINKKKGISVLFISHDLSVVRRLCTRVAVMQNGRIVEQGDVEDIFSNPTDPYTQQLIASIPKRRKRNE